MFLVSMFVDSFALGDGQEVILSGASGLNIEKIGTLTGRNTSGIYFVLIFPGSGFVVIVTSIIVVVVEVNRMGWSPILRC